MAWVYILECSDGSYYVGSTTNLELRLAQHQSGDGAKYTKRRRPVTLVWCAEYQYPSEAWQVERQLHGWSHAKRKLVVEGKTELLAGWSKRHRT